MVSEVDVRYILRNYRNKIYDYVIFTEHIYYPLSCADFLMKTTLYTIFLNIALLVVLDMLNIAAHGAKTVFSGKCA